VVAYAWKKFKEGFDLNELVLSEDRGRVRVLTLNRPEVLNALNPAIVEALAERIEDVRNDSNVLALILTGSGRAFAAGADIGEMRKMTPLQGVEFSRRGHEVLGAMEDLDIPTIAAVNGYALGGGCEVAMGCDWIYASAKARFGQPEVNLGLVPGFGGNTRLVRRVGVAWAKEIVTTGEPIDADTAVRIGLANRVFENSETLLAEAIAMGEKIATKGPVAVKFGKRLIQTSQDVDLQVANAYEQATFGTIFATEDRLEGKDAFLAKRDPNFKGR
jgi:enoyl-CoA hydratase